MAETSHAWMGRRRPLRYFTKSIASRTGSPAGLASNVNVPSRPGRKRAMVLRRAAGGGRRAAGGGRRAAGGGRRAASSVGGIR
ncbi:hypothetical protein [Streptomyces sp. NPDC059742]|uniref:hypothetical protein n=1 Tax=Streptomyces sp. NPDC059742 TaxID=3346927 RepID=UPI0036515FF2